MGTFLERYNGMLFGIRQWERWEAFRTRLGQEADGGWYVYYVGEDAPEAPLDAATFVRVLEEIDGVLRRDHDEPYLGIVYVDDFDRPELVKIYDPNNLGASCGSSGQKVPPGWILSRIRPEPLGSALIPEGRKRWWRQIFSRA